MGDGVLPFAVGVGLLLVAWSVRSRRGALPLVVHNAAFGVALLVFALPWIDWTPLSGNAWLLLGGSFATFNIGALTVLRLAPAAHRVAPIRWGTPILRRVVPALFFLGSLLYLRLTLSSFGSLLLTNPSQVRKLQGSDLGYQAALSLPIRILFSLGPLTLVTMALPRLSGVRLRRPLRWALILFTLVVFTATLARAYTFYALAWLAVSMVMTTDVHRVEVFAALRRQLTRTRRRRLAAIGLVGFLAIASFQLVGGALNKTYRDDPRIAPSVHEPLAGSPYTGLFIYVAGSIPAFGELVRASPDLVSPTHQTLRRSPYWGAAAAAQFAEPLGFDAPQEPRPFAHVPFDFNTYTWLDYFWLDYRWVGVLMMPFLVAFGLTVLTCRRPRSAEGLLAQTLFISALVFVPFANKLFDTYVLSSVLALAASHLYRRPVRGGPTRSLTGDSGAALAHGDGSFANSTAPT